MTKRPKSKQLGFYEPVSSVDGLRRLEERWRRDQVILLRLLWAAVAIGLLLIAINLVGTAFDETLSRGVRAWSVFPVLGIGLLLTPLVVRDLWLRRSVLAVQRRLLAHRGLLGRESEIRAAEGQIALEFAALSSLSPLVEEAFAGARRESERRLEELSRLGLERRRSTPVEPLGEMAEQRLIRLLDAYGLALETLQIEAALEPGGFQSGAVADALERAAGILTARRKTPAAAPMAVPRTRGAGFSVAVLPFADLSAEADQEYFANGLAEELISALTKIRDLRVIARGSAFSFRGKESEASEIGRQLGVDALIRGSVRRDGERLRVTVQLVDTLEGEMLWSERYDGAAGDVFSIQDQLTEAVIGHLRADLRSGLPEQLNPGRTNDVDAYHFYLRGRHLCNKRTSADLLDSLHYFEEAIVRDPDFALAHAGLADSHNLLGYYSILAPKETFPKARSAARRALELDETLAEAHCSLAFVMLLNEWDWRGAEREFLRTLELNPGYATAHHWYAEYLALTGRQDEAVAQAATALKLDPVSPIINVLVGWVYYYGGHYELAIEALKAALRVDSEFAPGEFWLGLTYEQLARPERARSAFERAISLTNRSPMLLAAMARLHAEQGETSNADTLLTELREAALATYVPAYYMAAVFSGYGDRERTLDWLETSLRDRESWMVFLNVDPIWDPYREEVRFRALVDGVGLPPAQRPAS